MLKAGLNKDGQPYVSINGSDATYFIDKICNTKAVVTLGSIGLVFYISAKYGYDILDYMNKKAEFKHKEKMAYMNKDDKEVFVYEGRVETVD